MDPDPPAPSGRKVKFAPKGPPRKTPKPVLSKMEVEDEDSDGDAVETQQALSRKVKEHLTRRGPKVDKKASVQVAFQHGITSSEIRTFGKQKDVAGNATDVEDSAFDGQKKELVTSSSTAGVCGFQDFAGVDNAFTAKKKREYEEPWDYHNSYYPTTLPLRRPYSGDPELLDKAEFEDAVEYDENTLNSASDLGLLDQENAPRMLFFQFPANIPLGRPQNSESMMIATADNMKAPERSDQKEVVHSHLPPNFISAASKGKEIVGSSSKVSSISTDAKGKEIAGSSVNPVRGSPSKNVGSLEELPEGYMGKMLVYKSGAVKFKLGDILYDVSPGSDCMFAQNVVAINTTDNHCVQLGELNKRAVVSPDIDSLVDNVIDMG